MHEFFHAFNFNNLLTSNYEVIGLSFLLTILCKIAKILHHILIRLQFLIHCKVCCVNGLRYSFFNSFCRFTSMLTVMCTVLVLMVLASTFLDQEAGEFCVACVSTKTVSSRSAPLDWSKWQKSIITLVLTNLPSVKLFHQLVMIFCTLLRIHGCTEFPFPPLTN